MQIAKQVATRSTCDKKHVGAVIVRDNTILSTGYNGSITHAPHCDEVGHDVQNGRCVRTVHAEMNAIAQAAKNGVSVNSSNIYITYSPCLTCLKLLANSGIKTIFFEEIYEKDWKRVLKYALESDVELREI